jgi:hypothetical protein
MRISSRGLGVFLEPAHSTRRFATATDSVVAPRSKVAMALASERLSFA